MRQFCSTIESQLNIKHTDQRGIHIPWMQTECSGLFGGFQAFWKMMKQLLTQI